MVDEPAGPHGPPSVQTSSHLVPFIPGRKEEVMFGAGAGGGGDVPSSHSKEPKGEKEKWT